MTRNNILCQDSLKVEIFVVGYKEQGESILCLVMCDNVCIFSILIDSYKKRNLFITDDIIKKHNINHLDLICWSHPHDDHSKGLKELIEKYKNEETEIFIPLRSDPYDNCSVETKKLFDVLIERSKSSDKTRIQIVNDNKNMLYYHDVGCILYNNERYEIKVESLAPISNQIINNIYSNYDKINEESLVFFLCIGGYSFLFTGDANNEEISQIPKNAIPENVVFIKIPHHCSKSSNKIIDIMKGEGTVACTTAYNVGSSNLPDTSVLEEYKEKNMFVENTNENCDTVDCDYGVAHIVFDILNGNNSSDFCGTAGVYK